MEKTSKGKRLLGRQCKEKDVSEIGSDTDWHGVWYKTNNMFGCLV